MESMSLHGIKGKKKERGAMTCIAGDYHMFKAKLILAWSGLLSKEIFFYSMHCLQSLVRLTVFISCILVILKRLNTRGTVHFDCHSLFCISPFQRALRLAIRRDREMLKWVWWKGLLKWKLLNTLLRCFDIILKF